MAKHLRLISGGLSSHLSEAQLNAYLEATLDDTACHKLETHVAVCGDCAQRLQQAAAFEDLLYQAASRLQLQGCLDEAPPPIATTSRPTRTRRRSIQARGGAGVLAAAASLVLMIGEQRGAVEVDQDWGPTTVQASETSERSSFDDLRTTEGSTLLCTEDALDAPLACTEMLALATFEPLSSSYNQALVSWSDEAVTWPDSLTDSSQWCSGDDTDTAALVCGPQGNPPA